MRSDLTNADSLKNSDFLKNGNFLRNANSLEDVASRRIFWLRVREFAVPPSMIEVATARRHTGDWAGACAAARIDVDLDLRRLARTHGTETAARIRSDLRTLAPDLLRWHMPRIAPDGLLRPGLSVCLARYAGGRDGPCLVVRTPPAWADADQRMSLAVWEGPGTGAHPDRRYRLDLHRHLWDAGRAGELRARCGADRPPPDHDDLLWTELRDLGAAVDRWVAEAAILRRATGDRSPGGAVEVRLHGRRRFAIRVDGGTVRVGVLSTRDRGGTLPLLPYVATWVPPDVDLLRTGAIDADRLHPLVASALVPGHVPRDHTVHKGRWRVVDCRGERHRIGVVDGVLTALDHDPAEVRREELLAALTGTPVACLAVIDTIHRSPECLADVRARLDHGDVAGALSIVEDLLGPAAVLRDGALRDELEAVARRRVVHGLFRAGLTDVLPRVRPPDPARTRTGRRHPRHAVTR